MSLLKKRFDGLALDGPDVTALHRAIIRTNPFLRHWYLRQYDKYKRLLAGKEAGRHIELGSGGGFLKEEIPFVTTSSLLPEDRRGGLSDLTLDAEKMDLEDASVDSFFMLDVFHHIKKPENFLAEAQRCLKKGGLILIIDPASTLFSRLLYKNFHHEPFDETAVSWETSAAGHLSGSNQALGHIIFERDRRLFAGKFPGLELLKVTKHTFASYLVSGGLSYEPLLSAPGARVKTALLDLFEELLTPLMGLLATSMDILVRKR